METATRETRLRPITVAPLEKDGGLVLLDQLHQGDGIGFVLEIGQFGLVHDVDPVGAARQ